MKKKRDGVCKQHNLAFIEGECLVCKKIDATANEKEDFIERTMADIKAKRKEIRESIKKLTENLKNKSLEFDKKIVYYHDNAQKIFEDEKREREEIAKVTIS